MIDQAYPWQRPLIEQVKLCLETQAEEVILAACPSSGKTTMAMILREEAYQDKLVVVLAHGTNVLKTQWGSKCDAWDISYGQGTNLLIYLPQAQNNLLEELAGRTIDLLIVDEAHEFYFAKMVQEIISKTRPRHQLLLTGTPSKFIYDNQANGKNRPIISFSGLEAYREGQLHNTYMALVRSSYTFTADDTEYDDDAETGICRDRGAYNTNAELKGSVNLPAHETEASLDDLVKEMVKRLKITLGKTSPNLINANLLTWSGIFGTLKKTMIAAASVEQANDIENALHKHGVNTIKSIFESDTTSENIQAFRDDQDIKVLIVVRRGILGLDMTDLCNVVDFTCSRNVNRIYQLYARVLRKYRDTNGAVDPSQVKYFFRLTSRYNYEADRIYTYAALWMNDPIFFRSFNGKNLNQMKILIPKKFTEPIEGEGGGTGPVGTSAPINIDRDLMEKVMSLELMEEAQIKSTNKAWDEWYYTDLFKCFAKLGSIVRTPSWNKLILLKVAKKLGYRLTKDPVEAIEISDDELMAL